MHVYILVETNNACDNLIAGLFNLFSQSSCEIDAMHASNNRTFECRPFVYLCFENGYLIFCIHKVRLGNVIFV